MTTEAPERAESAPQPPEETQALEETQVEPAEDESTIGGVLDLTDLTPTRRIVKLPTAEHPEGEQFSLRLVEDFGIEMQQKLLAWSRQYQKLMNADEELGKDQAERLRFVMDSLFEAVLDAPDETKRAAKATISDSHKGRVVTAFSYAPVVARQELQTALIQKLVDKGWVTQERVDEAIAEIRSEVQKSILGS